MAMKVLYTTIDGEIVSEIRAGTERDYLPDPLGSTVALLNSSQTKTDTFTYWPYGEVKTRTGSTATPLQFVGTLGYYRDSSTKTYVRARYLDVQKGRWHTQDPIGGLGDGPNYYSYVLNRPETMTDTLGLQGWGGTIDYCKLYPNPFLPLPNECNDPTGKPLSCDEICEKFRKSPGADPGMGGTVVCCGHKKCPCVLGLPKTRPPWVVGECPQIDRCALEHEKGHLPQLHCKSTMPLQPAPFPPGKISDYECDLWVASYRCLKGRQVTMSPKCKTVANQVAILILNQIIKTCPDVRLPLR